MTKLKYTDLSGSPPSTDVYGPPMPAAFEPGLVSVVMPSFNRAALIGETLDSIIAQTYRPIEIVIIDGASTDGTVEVVRKKAADLSDDSGLGFHLINLPKRKVSAARNQGLAYSHGEFIQFFDSDDLMICKKLENLVQVLRTDESMDVVWSDWWVLPSEQMKQKLTEANRIASAAPAPAWQVTDQPIPSELWPALFRRRFLAASKRWNEIADREEDWEYSLRLLAANPKRGHLPQVLCIQRLHQSVHRMAYTHLANPVAGALVTAREAARARQTSSVPNPRVDQMVADYFWERFLEALQLGTRPLAAEAIRGACRWGHRPPFRIKTRVCQILLKVLGTKATLALLRSRYCRNS